MSQFVNGSDFPSPDSNAPSPLFLLGVTRTADLWGAQKENENATGPRIKVSPVTAAIKTYANDTATAAATATPATAVADRRMVAPSVNGSSYRYYTTQQQRQQRQVVLFNSLDPFAVSEHSKKSFTAAMMQFDAISTEWQARTDLELGTVHKIPLFSPSLHLVERCWAAFKQYVLHQYGWTTSRRIATDKEKEACGAGLVKQRRFCVHVVYKVLLENNSSTDGTIDGGSTSAATTNHAESNHMYQSTADPGPLLPYPDWGAPNSNRTLTESTNGASTTTQPGAVSDANHSANSNGTVPIANKPIAFYYGDLISFHHPNSQQMSSGGGPVLELGVVLQQDRTGVWVHVITEHKENLVLAASELVGVQRQGSGTSR